MKRKTRLSLPLTERTKCVKLKRACKLFKKYKIIRPVYAKTFAALYFEKQRSSKKYPLVRSPKTQTLTNGPCEKRKRLFGRVKETYTDASGHKDSIIIRTTHFKKGLLEFGKTKTFKNIEENSQKAKMGCVNSKSGRSDEATVTNDLSEGEELKNNESEETRGVYLATEDLEKLTEICRRYTEEIKTGKEKGLSAKAEFQNILSANLPGLTNLMEELATVYELCETYKKEIYDIKMTVNEDTRDMKGEKKDGKTDIESRSPVVSTKDFDQTQSGNANKDEVELEITINAKEERENEEYKTSIEIQTKGSWGKSADPRSLKQLSLNIQNIWDNEWKEAKNILCEGPFPLDESEAIVQLSAILETCYGFCDKLTVERLKKSIKLLYPNDHKSLKKVCLSQAEKHHLYKIREKICMTAETKAYVFELFWKKCMDGKSKFSETAEKYIIQREETKHQAHQQQHSGSSENEELIKSEHEELFGLRKFVEACVEACWDAVISDPKIFLKFDILSLSPEDAQAQYNFKSYTLETSDPNSRKKNVIWPAVYIMINSKEEVIASANALALF